MDYFNPSQVIAETTKAGLETESLRASKDILSSLYAGKDAATVAANPQEQQSILNQASVLAGQKGLGSLAYSFQKQAADLNAATSKQQVEQLKVKEGEIAYAGQLLQGAQSTADLQSVVNETVKDPAAQLAVQSIMRRTYDADPAKDFEAKKKALVDMTKTADQQLKAQQITATAASALNRLDNTAEDNLRQRLAFKAQYNLPLSASELDFVNTGVIPGKTAIPTPTGGAGDASSTGRGAAESGDNYAAVNPKSGAMGRYQIMPDTLASLRKLDPSLPKTDAEFLKDPKAQDKAMKLLETEDKKSLKADGFKDSKVNLATYHRFGASDGKKVLSAFEDNPSTPLKDALGESRYNTVVSQNPDLKDKTVGQAIVQNYGTGSQPAATESTRLKKQGTGLPAERAGNILEATLQASKDLINVTKLPEATTLNTFAGLSGKDAKGIVSGLEGAFARTVTSGDQRAFEQLIAGLESTMATAVGGGFASAASKAKMEQYAKQIPRVGDNAESAAIFLARMKQELQTVREGFVDRQGANSEQVKKMDQAMADLDKAIPFTIDQVMEAKAKRVGGKTMGAKATATYGSGSKTSAADEAKAAGF
jgi:hypothetical protein